MTVPSALRSTLLLAILVAVPLGAAWSAQAIGVEQVIDLITAAKRISYGSPQTVTLSMDGSHVPFMVSVSVLGSVTAVPVAANALVKQVSIAVTTSNTGVVPSSVTVIGGDNQLSGFTVIRGPDGAIDGLVAVAPVPMPPPGSAQPPSPAFQALGVWQKGAGSLDGMAARPGRLFGAGVSAAAPAAAPGRLILLTAPNSVVTLGAGAEVSLATERDAAGTHLIIALARGAIEVSLGNKGGYRDVLVRGAATQVRITGALVVVDRMRRDADYVAVVAGQATVALRKEVAEAQGKAGQEVALLPHQGLAVSIGGGFGKVEALGSRPSVADATHTIHDQAISANRGFGDDHPDDFGSAASAPAAAGR